MTVEQIKARARECAGVHGNIFVRTLKDEVVNGVCTFAGKNKFRVDTPLASIFFDYDEVEAVQ